MLAGTPRRAMPSEHRLSDAWESRLVLLVIALVTVSLVASFVLYSGTQSSSRGANGGPAAYLNLTLTYNPATGNCAFLPGNVSVPAGQEVQVTITNYDPLTSHLYLGWQNQVVGALGGTMTVQKGLSGGKTTVSGVDALDIGHTFSILNPVYNLSVPIPPAVSPSSPTIVTFLADFPTSGTYQWGCMCDCNDSSMGTPEAMYGTLTVVA